MGSEPDHPRISYRSLCLTVWVGPLIVPHFSPRKLIIVGTGLTAIAFFGFGAMKGSFAVYFLLYFFYTLGYIISGPIPHQILVSYWFKKSAAEPWASFTSASGCLAASGRFSYAPSLRSMDFAQR